MRCFLFFFFYCRWKIKLTGMSSTNSRIKKKKDKEKKTHHMSLFWPVGHSKRTVAHPGLWPIQKGEVDIPVVIERFSPHVDNTTQHRALQRLLSAAHRNCCDFLICYVSGIPLRSWPTASNCSSVNRPCLIEHRATVDSPLRFLCLQGTFFFTLVLPKDA